MNLNLVGLVLKVKAIYSIYINNNSMKYEILLKLEDYYLINNIKLVGEIDDLIIHKIKFQSVKNGLWEKVPYFNPDKKEITIRDNEYIYYKSVHYLFSVLELLNL